MAVNYNSSPIAKDNLALHLDAANTKSYPGSGTSWYDLSGRNNHFTINASAFNSSSKYMNFNGSYGCAKKTGSDATFVGDYITAVVWINGSYYGSQTENFTIGNWGGANWVFGQRGNSTNWFNGKMGNVKVYNRKLSDQEVQQNFQAFRSRYSI